MSDFNTITNLCNVTESEGNVDTEGHVELSPNFDHGNIDTEGYVELSPNCKYISFYLCSDIRCQFFESLISLYVENKIIFFE